MTKVSSILSAAFLTMVATYMGDNELLKELKEITSYSMWLQLIQSFLTKSDKWFIRDLEHTKVRFERELRILDFYSNLHLLQELKNKMAWLNCFSNKIEEEMLIIVDELEKKINSFSVTIDDMCSLAQKYSLDTREAGISLNPFIADSNLRVTKFGVCYVRDEDIQQQILNENSVKEAMNILYQTTLLFRVDLPWYVCACGGDNYLIHSCYSAINDQTSNMIKLYLYDTKQKDSLVYMRKIFECIHEVHQKTLPCKHWSCKHWRWSYFIAATFKFYKELTSLLKHVYDSWLSLKLGLEQIVVKGGSNNYPYEEMVQQLRNISDDRHVYDKSGESVALVWEEAYRFLYFDNHNREAILEEEVERVLIAGVACVLVAYINDSRLMEQLSDIPTYSGLKRVFYGISMKDGLLFDKDGKFIKGKIRREKFEMWEFNRDEILGDLKNKMALSYCFTKETEEEIVNLIEKLDMKIEDISSIVTNMYTDACKYYHELKDSGIANRMFREWEL